MDTAVVLPTDPRYKFTLCVHPGKQNSTNRALATGCNHKQLDCDVDRVQRGDQRFNYVIHRPLIGRPNGLRNSSIYCVPIYHLSCGAAQIGPPVELRR
jgi:hypothetical protein